MFGKINNETEFVLNYFNIMWMDSVILLPLIIMYLNKLLDKLNYYIIVNSSGVDYSSTIGKYLKKGNVFPFSFVVNGLIINNSCANYNN